MKPVIRETVITCIELDDLDLVVEDELLGTNPDGHDYDWKEDYDQQKYWKENEHIPIKLLVDAVNNLKKQGVTHVQIVPHCDHHSYHLTGVKLEVMSEEDVKQQEKEKLELAIKNHKLSMGFNKQEMSKNKDFLTDMKKQLDELNE